jgi:hypothetical protein
MISATEECNFHIARYRHMARATTDTDIKKRCEQLVERWTRKAAKCAIV